MHACNCADADFTQKKTFQSLPPRLQGFLTFIIIHMANLLDGCKYTRAGHSDNIPNPQQPIPAQKENLHF